MERRRPTIVRLNLNNSIIQEISMKIRLFRSLMADVVCSVVHDMKTPSHTVHGMSDAAMKIM